MKIFSLLSFLFISVNIFAQADSGSQSVPIGDGLSVNSNQANEVSDSLTECSKKAKNQEDADRCKEQAVQSCSESGGYCHQQAELMMAQGRQITDVESEVKKINNNSQIASLVDFQALNCMEVFAGEKEGRGLAAQAASLNYLNENIGEYGASGELSEKMYITSQQCQEFFGSGGRAFTDIRSKLKLNRNKQVKFCLDMLSASRFNPEREAHCSEALRLITTKNKFGKDKCIRPVGSAGMAQVDLAIDRADYISSRIREQCEEAEGRNSAYAVRECIKQRTELIGSDLNGSAGEQEIDPECNQAYETLKACYGSEPNYTQVAAGCVGLNLLAREVDAKDIEDSETSYQSIDSKIKCVLKAPGSMVYAVDYGACVKAAYFYNAAFLGADMAGPLIGNAVETYQNSDIQGDMVKDSMKGGVDSQTAALKAQRKQYKNKANLETTNSVLQGTKAIAMFGNMATYPTPSVVSEKWCLGGNSGHYDLPSAAICSIVYMADRNAVLKEELFANQGAKRIMLDTGFQALSKAVVHAIIAGTYKKRAKLVGKVETALKDADFNQPGNQFKPGVAFCKANPTIPSCKGAGAGGGRFGRNGGVDFSFSGTQPQGGQEVELGDGKDLGRFGDDNNSIAKTNSAQDDLSNILADDSDGKLNNKEFNQVAPAKVSAAGGGSGGGSGGGAGGGGGSAATAPAGGREGKPQASNGRLGKKVQGRYVSGSSGSFARGGKLRKSKKTDNPFAAFGKKPRSRKIASEVEKELHPKKVKLFEIISERYTAVNAAGSLEKVEEE